MNGAVIFRRAIALAVGLVIPTAYSAVVFQFDYRYDTSNFFDTQDKKDALEAAGRSITSQLGDTLSGIAPGGINTWSAVIIRPDTGATFSIVNPIVPVDTILVYAGGRNLGESTLGQAGAGGFSSSGTSAWGTTVRYRGEDLNGATTTATSLDFGPWGGHAAFNNNSGVNWNFSLNPPGSGQTDFYSVALHELTHLVGFSEATPSMQRWIGGTTFAGPVTTAQNGGVPAPMNSQESGGNNSHFKSGLTSTLPYSTTPQVVGMIPTIGEGTRRELTKLDFAVLDDIGWDVNPAIYSNVVPEPEEYAAAAGLGLVVFAVWRRIRRS